MPTHDSHHYNRWKYDNNIPKPYDGYQPYDTSHSFDHYTPYDHYGFDDHDGFNDHYNDYGYASGYGGYGSHHGGYGYGGYGNQGGYMHADDFAAQKQEKVQGKNIGAQKQSSQPEKQQEVGESLTPEEEQELKGLPDAPEKAEMPERQKMPR